MVPICGVKGIFISASNYNNLAYLSLLTIGNLVVDDSLPLKKL
jgi:hypothetical protein